MALLDESCSTKVGVSGLVANNFLKNTLPIAPFVSIGIIKTGIAVALESGGNFLSQIKTIPLIQAGGHEEAFGLSFAKEDFKK